MAVPTQTTNRKVVDRPFRQSGQSIIKEFIDTIDTAAKANPELETVPTWVRRHLKSKAIRSQTFLLCASADLSGLW